MGNFMDVLSESATKGEHTCYNYLKTIFTTKTNCYCYMEPQIGDKRPDFLLLSPEFGIVIIEAVRIAGVLTVFAFLILPASISALFTTRWKHRMLVGLISGVVAAFLGLHFSISLDLTASPY